MIYDMINDRANKTWSGPAFKSPDFDYKVWVKHWFDVAEALKKEFEDEGLEQSAKYVQAWIDTNRRMGEARD